MKNRIILTTLIAAAISTGCAREDINTDPNSAYSTIASTVIPYAQKALSDYVTTPNVNENNSRLLMQYWTEVIYTQESNYDYASRSVSDQIYFDNYVRVLNNLQKSKILINEYVPTTGELATWPQVKANQIAIVDMMMVYTYQNLVDTFGNIPYTEAINIESFGAPKYDDAATIYSDLITRLTADINSLSVNTTSSLGAADLYYAGSVPKWKKFGASVLLKLGIALSDVNPTLAQNTVKSAISFGPIVSSADDCKLTYLATPNYNPLYGNLVASGRTDYVAGKPLVDYMLNNNDGRISKYFVKNNLDTPNYVGSPIGIPAAQAEGGLDGLSQPGAFATTATTPGILINATEVNFYLAEAAQRWGIGSAADYYNAAINASFAEWGATGAATYLAAHPYDSANWKKSIGEQAWVAMYNQPLTAWNFWRRLDYPMLQPAAYAVAASEKKIPVRMVYSNRETSTNAANVAAAATAIGGDKMTTKIFWDKY